MSAATKKAFLSIVVNSVIAGVSAALSALLVQVQTFWGTEIYFPLLFAGLKALQQLVARQTGTGGENPTGKIL